MELPPGPRAPALAQTVEWIARPTVLLRRAHARYGDPFTLRIGWADAPMVLVSDPDAVRRIFRADPAVLRAGASSSHLEPFAGPTSILVLDGDEHLRVRRSMLPPFHGEALARWAGEMAALARAEIASWPREAIFPVLPRMRALTARIILRVVFGTEDPVLLGAVRRALDLTASLPRMLAMGVVQRDLGPRSPYGAFVRAVREADRVLLERARDAPPDSVAGRFADRPRSELRDALVTLLAAGHETTATSLAWALERLARHPADFARLRDDASYADAIAQETLRIRPVLSIAPRKLAAPYEVAGWTLPAGVHVAACIYLLHRRADLYGPDATAFRPARWLGDDPPSDAYAWIPFGGGSRRCLGAAFAAMELREVLVAVAGRWPALAPERAAGERVRRSSVVLAPARGARISVAAGRAAARGHAA